jgi:hypothetical protein
MVPADVGLAIPWRDEKKRDERACGGTLADDLVESENDIARLDVHTPAVGNDAEELRSLCIYRSAGGRPRRSAR